MCSFFLLFLIRCFRGLSSANNDGSGSNTGGGLGGGGAGGVKLEDRSVTRYGRGRVIRELGLRRTDLIISTKILWGLGTRKGANDGGLSLRAFNFVIEQGWVSRICRCAALT